MARQKGILVPRIKKGLHPDVLDEALRMVLPEETLDNIRQAGKRPSKMYFVQEYDDEYGGPVWYIP